MKPENCELERKQVYWLKKSASMARAIIKIPLSCMTKGKIYIYAIRNYKVDILTIVGAIREL